APDHQPQQGADAGAWLPGAREWDLHFRSDAGARSAVARRNRHSARRLRGGVRDGDRHFSYQPRIRSHGRRSIDSSQGLVRVGAGLVHSALTASLWADRERFAAPLDPADWLALDATGLLFLSIVSLLFLTTSYYTVGYLRREHEESHQDVEEGFYFRNAPEAV